ncbi:MAG: hypothetical protein M3O06_09305 [Pseudomonadota bacterium]|nr:hypothetical protein [Pseudomonadota bacterium]
MAGWLEEDAESRLHAAEQSFTAIGLKGVARVLRRGRCHLTDIDLPVSPRRVARAIETALAGIDEPVDEAIARFAKQKARERHSS